MYRARLRHRRSASLFALLTVIAGICQAAALKRTPYLQNVSAGAATIIWTAAERASAEVRYSENGDLTRSAPAVVSVLPASPGEPSLYQYRVDLRNLKPSRDYFYEVLSGGAVIASDLRFRTAGPGPFRFLVFGDSGTGSDAQFALARRMAETENPSLVIHTGDLSQENGTPEQLDATYLRVYADLMARAPFFASPGNHDYYTDSGKPCFAIHAPPIAGVAPEDLGRYYSYDWGNVHFVSLNSNLLEYPDAADRMLQWLDRDLAAQKNFWKVVYFHHPPYPTGHHLNDPVTALVRERIVPVLDRHGVQVVFTGHEHSYQRTWPLRGGQRAEDGTVYVTTGGGGGVLHYINPGELHAIGKSLHHYIRAEVRGARMTLTVIGLDGEIVDTVTITAPSQPAVEAVVNSASYTPALAPGSLVSIFGRGLATDERSPAAAAFDLAGASVSLEGEKLPLFYAAPHQINAQLPYRFTGSGTLKVTTRNAVDEIPIQVNPAAPAILQAPSGFRYYPSIWNALTGSLVTVRAPARPGDYVTIYLVGLGAVAGSATAGEKAAGEPLLYTLEPVRVQIGSMNVPALFAGLTPGFAGLYQVNVRIPTGVESGAAALRVFSSDSASEPVTLFVGN